MCEHVGNAVSANAFVIVAISSTVNVISSTFISNTGGNFGGGLSLAGGNLNVQDSMYVYTTSAAWCWLTSIPAE